MAPRPTGPTDHPSEPSFSIVDQLQTQWLPASRLRADGTVESLDLDGRTFRWTDKTVFYTIVTDPDAPVQDTGSPEFKENVFVVGMSPTRAAIAATAFELWDDLIALNLEPGTARSGHVITFAQVGRGDAHTPYVDNSDIPIVAGGNDYAINSRQVWMAGAAVDDDHDFSSFGQKGFWTYLHEIGHSLGLSHPGSYDGEGATYAHDAEYAQDTKQFTVMSYFGKWVAGSDGIYRFDITAGVGDAGLFPQTPMLHDVLAIQAKYGADTSTRGGDTTYGFHSTADKDVFNFELNRNPVLTIWDGGGNDTLDVSGFGNNQHIDLHTGTFSDVGALEQNVAIAYGTTIENAIGGGGNDTIIGNDVSNRLEGGLGQDAIYGNGGGDRLIGDAGDDILFGGAGSDTLTGGPGKDIMYGGDGGGGDRAKDLFVFQALTDSDPWLDRRDVVMDFEQGIDRIDLSAIDANSIHPGNDPFRFVPEFTGRPGELQWDRTGGTTFMVTADVNGDAIADFALQINMPGAGLAVLRATDFIL